jgi:biopolymer transport protein ExbD
VRTVKLFCSLDRTPFVSVRATLFAIFVFTVVLIAGRPRIGGLDLPKVNNPIYEPDANKEDAIALAVFYDGRIFWGQDAISVGDLLPKLRDRVGRRPEASIYLNVDAQASYRNVGKVLDALRSAGVGRVVFLVDQRKSQTWVVDYSPHFWNIVRLWISMDWLGRADFMLLALMLANTGAIICSRLHPSGVTQKRPMRVTSKPANGNEARGR